MRYCEHFPSREEATDSSLCLSWNKIEDTLRMHRKSHRQNLRLDECGCEAHLNLHALGLDDVDLVLVAAPHLVVDHGHATDGVVGAAQVHQVVVGQIPLAVCWETHRQCEIQQQQQHLWLDLKHCIHSGFKNSISLKGDILYHQVWAWLAIPSGFKNRLEWPPLDITSGRVHLEGRWIDQPATSLPSGL